MRRWAARRCAVPGLCQTGPCGGWPAHSAASAPLPAQRRRPAAPWAVPERAASTGGGRGDGPRLWDPELLQRWTRGARTRAELACSEWRDRASDWRYQLRARQRQWQRQWQEARPTERASFRLNGSLDRAHARWREANQRFDKEFNARWAALESGLRQSAGSARRRLQAQIPTQKQSQNSAGPPLDTTAMVLLGVGVGSAIQGCVKAGTVFALWGLARGAHRFVVQKVDSNDMAGLFRWAPARLRERRAELFARLKREIHVARAIRAGDPAYFNDSFSRREGGQAMDARFDYTPERLFADAMASAAAHPRVQELLGPEVRAAAEPDKVVYRVHEGIAEVFLGWEIVGRLGRAEVQVKATASIVDFIYIFPQTGDRFGFIKPGFVIRPRGTWSLDCSELPHDLKQPFGERGDRRFHHRTGIFDYDYEVRDFRHGREGKQQRRAWW